MTHKIFPTVANQPKPLTKRQLELLVAASFGELRVVQQTDMDRRNNWWHFQEPSPTGRMVDVTGTIRTLNKLKLLRLRFFVGAKEGFGRYYIVTPLGQSIVDGACTDLR